jgi:ATP-binding cassette, subfamily B, bacterial
MSQERDFQQINPKIWLRLIKQLASHQHELLMVIVFMVLIAIVDVSIPYLTKIIVDNYLGKPFTNDQLILVILQYTGLVVWQTINILGLFHYTGKVEMYFAYETRRNLFRKLQELSFSYYDKTSAGWIMARMSGDISRLAEIVSWELMDLFWGGSLIVFLAGVMLVINWQLALVVLSVVPIMAYLSYWFQSRILSMYRKIRKQNSMITAAYAEAINGAKTSKTLVLEEQNISEFNVLTKEMKVRSLRAAFYNSLFVPLVMALAALGSAGLLWYGGYQVLAGLIPIGTLLLFSQYAGQFFEPLRQIARLIAQLQLAQASGERVLSLLDEQPRVVDTPQVIAEYGDLWQPLVHNYPALEGKIEFRNVGFYYNEKEVILDEFNLLIPQGKMTALVGTTGGGKSTIVNLLCRFYEPTSGMILIDDLDYRERSIGWLHSHLGYVLQTPYLFDATVMENVRYGNDNITEEQVIECCKLVQAHEFIMLLEQGYQTRLNEGGNRLSSGQKQLISFARALCANPRILVLDEATSFVDSESEHQLQQALTTLLTGRTSIVVAHRLSTIRQAHQIVVIEHGKILEQGSFATLMQQKGTFSELYHLQQRLEAQQQLYEQVNA